MESLRQVGGGHRCNAERVRHALPAWQAECNAAEKVSRRKNRHETGEAGERLEAGRHEAVDATRLVLNGDRNPRLEERVEIDHPVREHRQAGVAVELEDLPKRRVRKVEVHEVVVADHAVPEPIRRDRKLDRHSEWASDRRDDVQYRGIDDRRAADPAKEILHDRPLVVVGHDALCLGEDVAAESRCQQHVDDRIVKPQHGMVELDDDEVLVVPRVTNGRGIRHRNAGNIEACLGYHAARQFRPVPRADGGHVPEPIRTRGRHEWEWEPRQLDLRTVKSAELRLERPNTLLDLFPQFSRGRRLDAVQGRHQTLQRYRGADVEIHQPLADVRQRESPRGRRCF